MDALLLKIVFMLAIVSVFLPNYVSLLFIVLHDRYCLTKGNIIMWNNFPLPPYHARGFVITCQNALLRRSVKEMKELGGGFNIVGLSQGNLIGRGIVEFCDGVPPVNNFVSMCGPHAGTASVPLCGSGIFCLIADELMILCRNTLLLVAISKFLQSHLWTPPILKPVTCQTLRR